MNAKLFLLMFSVCFGTLFGGIEDYFKKPTDKSGYHGMKNVDFIYMINLDQRPEKFLSCTDQLHPYGIYPYRFSAVNGWELSLEDINNLGVKYEPWMRQGLWGTSYLPEDGGQPHHEVLQVPGQTYFCHCMARGPIGIVLSHLSVLQDAYDSGYETIWVMEDDIQILQDPHLISRLITRLDSFVGRKNWDILFTDRDTKDQNGNYVPCLGYAYRPNYYPPNPERFAKRTPLGNDFMKIGARYGTYSMIVRRQGMKKILDFIKGHQIFLPFDMDFYQIPTVNIYTVINDVVSTQPQALSDNGGPNYENK